jgi:hypothetical protein
MNIDGKKKIDGGGTANLLCADHVPLLSSDEQPVFKSRRSALNLLWPFRGFTKNAIGVVDEDAEVKEIAVGASGGARVSTSVGARASANFDA